MNNLENKKRGSSAFLALIFGILSILPVLGIFTAILSVIFGSVAIKNKNRSALAITGIVIALLLSISVNVFTFSLINKGQEQVEQYKNSPEYQVPVQNNN